MTNTTPRLYRGAINNGVHTVLTEEAVRALELRQQVFQGSSSYDGTEALLAIIAKGTFTFVSRENMGHFGARVAGSLDDLAAWTARNPLIPRHLGSNYVPFSNGLLDQDPEYIRAPWEVTQAFGLLGPTRTE